MCDNYYLTYKYHIDIYLSLIYSYSTLFSLYRKFDINFPSTKTFLGKCPHMQDVWKKLKQSILILALIWLHGKIRAVLN